MSLFAPAHTDCSSWMCFVGAWGCSAASKGRENHFTGLIFHKASAQIPNFLQLETNRVPQFPADLQEGSFHSRMVPGVYPSTGDSHIICGVSRVFTAPSYPGQGWIPGTAASPSGELKGPMPCLSDSQVVYSSIKCSPAEEIHCSFAEPAKLWCQHIFLPWNLATASQITLTDFLFPLRALGMWKWDSSCKCRHCSPVLSWFAVGRSVAVGCAGSFPHPSPSWSNVVGVFPKYCSAEFFRNGHTEPRQVN